jgi:hypothetical protein
MPIDNSEVKTNKIREIQRLLNDAYGEGFPILKEILQNANDRNAKNISILYIKGFQNADHPLLKNHPSLVIHNDGEFKDNDSEDIKTISGEGKAKDETVVGKFGVGMKSVFHLCDMFFYVSTFTEGTNKGKLKVATFNPWIGDPDKRHSEWEKTTDKDENALTSYYQQNCGNSGFLLVIPLKLYEKDIHVSPNNIFTNGIGDFFCPAVELDDKIYQSLAVINTTSLHKPALQTIEVKIPDYKDKIYTLEDVKFAKYESPKAENSVIGSRITDQGKWPHDTKKPSVATSCTIIRLPQRLENSENLLKIGHAVFLPLEDEREERIETKFSYSLILHGEFAIDSGRRNIKHGEDINTIFNIDSFIPAVDDDEAFKQWNQFIAQKCLYPLIPDIFSKGIDEGVIDSCDIEPLLKKLREYYYKNNALPFVTSKNSLSKIYNYGNGEIKWSIFLSNKQVFLFPSFKSGQNPLSYFSNELKEQIKQGTLVLALPDNTTDAYFLNTQGYESIESIVSAFNYGLLQEEGAKTFYKSYIELLQKQGKLTMDVISIFAKKCVQHKHPELFETFFSRHIEYEKLHGYINAFWGTPIFPVKIIDNTDVERIVWKTFSEIRELYVQDILYSKRGPAQDKSLEFYKLLTGNFVYENASTWFQVAWLGQDPDPIGKIAANIETLKNCIDEVDLNVYDNEIRKLLPADIEIRKFCRYPIHKLENRPGYHSIEYNNSYRGIGQVNNNLFPENFLLPRDKVVVINNPNETINRLKLQLRQLEKTECIKLFFEHKDTINTDDEVTWILENFDSNKREELLEILKNKAWIPVAAENENKYIRPELIYTDDFVNAGTINYLKKTIPIKGIYTRTDIDSKYRDGIVAIGILRNSRENFLKTIAKKIFYSSDDYLREFDINSSEMLVCYTEILDKMPFKNIYQIISKLFEDKSITRDGNENIYNYFYTNLKNDTPNCNQKYYVDRIKYINTINIDDNIISIFNRWIERLITLSDFDPNIFKYIKFPNARNQWQPSSELLYDPQNENKQIKQENKLLESTNEILRRNVDKFVLQNKDFDPNHINPEPIITNAFGKEPSSVEDIHQYFSKWVRSHENNKKLTGFLLYIIGGEFRKTSLEKGYVTQSDINIFPDNINELNIWSHEQGVLIEIYEVNEIRLMSLSGDTRSFSTVFSSNTQHFNPIRIDITTDIAGLTDELLKILIQRIIWLAYTQLKHKDIIPDYTEFFSKLLKSNIIYLENTRRKLRKGIFNTIDGFSLSTDLNFVDTVNEYNHYDDDNNNVKMEECINVMMNKIIQDTNMQKIFRNSIKRHLSNSEYTKTSILYELFQNSDDAMSERIENTHERIPDEQNKFEIAAQKSFISISHFGRKITQKYTEENTSYQYDLWNMLRIHSSYKESSIATGKYGLGFKSVYFICDEPIIRSGDLQVKIIAGFYPESLEETLLRENETRIELKLNNDNDKYFVVDDFVINCPFQCVFSNSIHRISKDNEIYSWEPDKAKTITKSIDSNLSYTLEYGFIVNDNYLLITIRGEKKTNFLFKFDDKTKSVMPIKNESISKIWHTTPLNNGKTLEFAVNADFQVNIGRKTAIADQEELIQTIGKELGLVLSDIDENNINIATIFDVLIPAYGKDDKLLKSLPEFAIKVFFDKTGKLPTGNSSFFNPEKNPAFFYCPDDHSGFSLKQGRGEIFLLQLSEFIGNQDFIETAFLGTYFAYECWKSIFVITPIRINDIFVLLDHLKENLLTPNALCEFITITENFNKFKSRYDPTWKIYAKSGNLIICSSLYINDTLADQLSDEYNEKELKFIGTHFNNYFSRIPRTPIVIPGPKPIGDNTEELFSRLREKLSDEQIKNILDSLDRDDDEDDIFDPDIDTEKPFPEQKIHDLQHLQKTTEKNYTTAPDVKYEQVLRQIRTSRTSDRAHLRDRYEGFCQICEQPSQYWEVAEIFNKPKKEVEQMNLSLCPNCASMYRQLRNNNDLMLKFANEIRICDPLLVAEIPLADIKIKFLQTHLAEIQTILNLDKSIPAQSNEEIV